MQLLLHSYPSMIRRSVRREFLSKWISLSLDTFLRLPLGIKINSIEENQFIFLTWKTYCVKRMKKRAYMKNQTSFSFFHKILSPHTRTHKPIWSHLKAFIRVKNIKNIFLLTWKWSTFSWTKSCKLYTSPISRQS